MSKITIEDILFLMDNGLTQSEIARRSGVTRQYIHKILRANGYLTEAAVQTTLIRTTFP